MELCTKNEENPWMVEELEEFLYYCCPECDEKCRAKGPFLQHALCTHPNVRNANTLVKSSRIYTGQYTFPILLLNVDNMLGEHKGREFFFVYRRLF